MVRIIPCGVVGSSASAGGVPQRVARAHASQNRVPPVTGTAENTRL